MTVTSVVRRLKELTRLASAEDGQALVEYALLLSLVMVVAVVAVQTFGLGVSGLFSRVVAVYPK